MGEGGTTDMAKIGQNLLSHQPPDGKKMGPFGEIRSKSIFTSASNSDPNSNVGVSETKNSSQRRLLKPCF
jgi:hypothetical protein